MLWTIISKTHKEDEVKDYRNEKDKLAKEGNYKCVYCCINESSFGGTRNFHVEHYRPKSKFSFLANKYSNLFYACSICNCFKGNDWPNEPNDEFNKSFYPDPSLLDYSKIINIDFNSGILSGENKTSNYLIHKLFLNRPQLLLERRHYALSQKFNLLLTKFELLQSKLNQLMLEKNPHAIEISIELNYSFNSLCKLINKDNSRPYTNEDITRNAR